MTTPKQIFNIVENASQHIPEINEEKIEFNAEYAKTINNIPTRYRNANLDECINLQQEKAVKAIRNALNGKILKEINDILLYGTVGTGKTYIACGLVNKLCDIGYYAKYITEHNLLEYYFQKQFDKFQQFRGTQFLVIDELGKLDLVDWQKIQIEELLSYRYNECLPTMIITNMDISTFKKFVGDRIVDRLRDNKVVRINFEGESLRGSI